MSFIGEFSFDIVLVPVLNTNVGTDITQCTDNFVSVEVFIPVSKKEDSACPIDALLSVLDGRWKGTILWRLLDGPLRTGELRRSIPQITERMLIRHLQELVRDGILYRHDEGTVPPCVRYSISPYGMTLVPVLETICAWGRQHLARKAISSSRKAR